MSVVDDLVFLQGVGRTKHTLREWNRHPWAVMRSWVLGSVVIWLLLFVPIYLASRFAVVRYRATLGERVRQSHFYKVLSASQAYNVYRWFRP